MSDDIELQAILADATKAGLYHLPHTDKKHLVSAAKAGGLATFRVNLAKAGDKTQMLAAIAKTLKFPDWFGHNLDALADCLADMAWQPADGYLILLEHCDGINGKAEADFLGALKVFEQAAKDWREEGIPFWCLVEMKADGIAWLPTEP
jgi:RNAse (barnase) inhibitor barstar